MFFTSSTDVGVDSKSSSFSQTGRPSVLLGFFSSGLIKKNEKSVVNAERKLTFLIMALLVVTK